MEVVRYGDKCIVKQDNSSKSVEAEVLEFKEKKNLIAVLNKSVKLNMIWNGKLYEGKMAGLDFITAGPSISKTTSVRG